SIVKHCCTGQRLWPYPCHRPLSLVAKEVSPPGLGTRSSRCPPGKPQTMTRRYPQSSPCQARSIASKLHPRRLWFKLVTRSSQLLVGERFCPSPRRQTITSS